jgi:hypothetical protein
MIKTAMGDNLNCETLNHKFHQIISDEFENLHSIKIDCFQEDDYLVILISESVTELIDRIKDILKEYQIVNNFLICNIDDVNKIYYNSIDNNLKDIKKRNYYSSQNFSVGFIVSILGLICLSFIGIFYYFTRPCVLGECKIITETEKSISNQFKADSQSVTEENIKTLQIRLIAEINELKRIPPWSKYYKDASFLIEEYEQKVNQLDNILVALQLEKDSINLTKNLPLSLDEWTRIKGFWQESIELINTLNIDSLEQFKQEKLNFYQSQLIIVNNGINQEKQADKNLINAQNLVIEIENKQKEVTSLSDLESIERSWQTAIKQVESIEPSTQAYQEKETLLKSYLTKLMEIQKQISKEKNALNIKKQAETNIKEALKLQNNNQWTKAVTSWENALKELKKISPETLTFEQIKNLENNTSKQLETAKSALKKALVRQQMKAELDTICNNSELKCSYSIGPNTVKIFLNQEYLQKISKLSSLNSLTNNDEQKKQINNHIEQVEKNYQYISTKYKILVEVYNPQRQLIMIYHTSI